MCIMMNIKSGSIVKSQGKPRSLGVVLEEPHSLADWVWVNWEHIGRWDEYVYDLIIVKEP